MQGRKLEEWLGIGGCLEDCPVGARNGGGQMLGKLRGENQYRCEKIMGTTALTRKKHSYFPQQAAQYYDRLFPNKTFHQTRFPSGICPQLCS